MKKLLLTSVSALALVVAATVPAQAENTAYGFKYSTSFGLAAAEFDMAAVNDAAATAVTTSEIDAFKDLEYFGFYSGTSYKNGYIAVVDDENYEKALASINMTTGEINKLRVFQMIDANSIGYAMIDIAYDASADKLYALEYGWNEAMDGPATTIYSVDPTSFDLTEYTCFSNEVKTIAAKDGDIYVNITKVGASFEPVPVIYKLDAEKQPTIKVAEASAGAKAENLSMAFDAAGDLYYAAGASMFKADFAAQTISLIGTTSNTIAGLTFSKSTENVESTYEAPKDVRNLVSIMTYGTAMGDAPDTLDTKETKFFYDINNQLISMIEYARVYDQSSPTGMGDYAISYIHRYEFDEEGKVISHVPLQYGMYDYGDFAFRETQNKETFEYNEKGQKVKTINANNTILYAYNEDGLLETEAVTLTASGDTTNLTTYYYFDEEVNKPTVVVTESKRFPQSTYDNRAVVYGYDENGNKVGAYTKELGKLEDVNDMMGGLFTFGEAWEYNENNDMISYVKFQYTENAEIDTLATTVGEYVDGNMDKIRYTNYSFWKGYRTRSGLPQVYTYQTFNASTVASIAVKLGLEEATEPLNTVKLTWNLPAVFMTTPGKFDIYRDGLKIATKDMMEAIDPTSDTYSCVFGDTLIPNGNHQYFVQPLVGIGDEMGTEMVWTPYNTSNIATVELDTELPAVTDLHATDKYISEVQGSDENGAPVTEKVTMLNLEWTNPADAEKYGFISNSLMCDNFQLSENVSTSLDVNTASYATFNNTHKFFVLTRYNIGKAFSNEITVDLAEVPDLTGIESVTTDGITVAVNGKVVEVSEAAHIAVFATNGAKVAETSNATSLSLADAAAGAYIICVEKAGKVSTFKAVLK